MLGSRPPPPLSTVTTTTAMPRSYSSGGGKVSGCTSTTKVAPSDVRGSSATGPVPRVTMMRIELSSLPVSTCVAATAARISASANGMSRPMPRALWCSRARWRSNSTTRAPAVRSVSYTLSPYRKPRSNTLMRASPGSTGRPSVDRYTLVLGIRSSLPRSSHSPGTPPSERAQLPNHRRALPGDPQRHLRRAVLAIRKHDRHFLHREAEQQGAVGHLDLEAVADGEDLAERQRFEHLPAKALETRREVTDVHAEHRAGVEAATPA